MIISQEILFDYCLVVECAKLDKHGKRKYIVRASVSFTNKNIHP